MATEIVEIEPVTPELAALLEQVIKVVSYAAFQCEGVYPGWHSMLSGMGLILEAKIEESKP